MEYENKETKVNIEEDIDKKNLILKTEDNNTDVPNQNIKKEPNILKQFITKKVYLVAISVFSILTFLLPIFVELNEFFYRKIIKIRLKEKEIEKTIEAVFNDRHTEMNIEESKRLMYRYALIPMIYSCILAPFVEEYLFRWLIFGFIKNFGKKIKINDKLKGNLVTAFAFIFSSILFSFAHFDLEGGNLYIKIIYCRTYWDISYFILGIFFAYIYSRYGFILITILVQMIFNIINTLYATYMFASDCYDGCAINAIFIILPVYGFTMLVVLILVVRLIIKLVKKCKK
ncbi:hypothetical protein PIROE2DRAFT_67163 [Piromyces sp. E2]|nr:hypothetical protein PIROE2DRAFT_67163 [Piromyces sp. E2]|eukprot:OUM65880.1 hypothetical protein PIROE2DRAFT_67163 [Piromyces sp. E2]